MAPATSFSTVSRGQPQQQQHGGQVQPTTVASAILKRHVENRQRFDSADYAMIHSAVVAAAAAATGDCASQPLRSDRADCSLQAPDEHEPEPEQQHVRRIRLQRFDSADWVMDASTLGRSPRASESDASVSTDTATLSTHTTTVAKLLLERHAYTTCHFVTTPVNETHRSCAERA
ncbi:hypothetical protein PybrP1_001114 [[Pythium] brassicae (nom. inval.)]|nr:hypothetical protein PybrP1_001114 [[Pythium] brassicae (nom. inval.)]